MKRRNYKTNDKQETDIKRNNHVVFKRTLTNLLLLESMTTFRETVRKGGQIQNKRQTRDKTQTRDKKLADDTDVSVDLFTATIQTNAASKDNHNKTAWDVVGHIELSTTTSYLLRFYCVDFLLPGRDRNGTEHASFPGTKRKKWKHNHVNNSWHRCRVTSFSSRRSYEVRVRTKHVEQMTRMECRSKDEVDRLDDRQITMRVKTQKKSARRTNVKLVRIGRREKIRWWWHIVIFTTTLWKTNVKLSSYMIRLRGDVQT